MSSGRSFGAAVVDLVLTCADIARRLGLRDGTVQGWVGKIYKRRGVHKREELRKVVRAMAAPGEGAKAAG